MKIGCHAVLFGPRIADETTHILQMLHEAGAEGAEIGSRFFGIERSRDLMASLADSGMELSGLHVSAKLTQILDDPASVEKAISDAALFLTHTDCRNIVFTGQAEDYDAEDLGDPRLADRKTLAAMASKLNDIVKSVYDKYSVRVNYHNHNWEFRNDAAVYEALIEYAPDLFLGLDTCWAAISGYDPVKIISRVPARVNYVHLRDYRKSEVKGADFKSLQDSFVPLGSGDMDYAALMNVLKDVLGAEGWAVVEYEVGEQDAGRYRDAVNIVRSYL